MKKVGKVLLCPGQHLHFLEVFVAETRTELKHAWTKYCGKSKVRFSPRTSAFCATTSKRPKHNRGALVFLRSKLSYEVVAHEVTHGVLDFISRYVVTSQAFSAMSEKEQLAYYHEACAQMVGQVYAQAALLLL